MACGGVGEVMHMPPVCHSFTHAITRRPAPCVVDGLQAADTGTPDLETFLAHHADYITALRSTGATVVELDPLANFPDACFVEDTALCLPQGAVLMRPGAPTRLGEVAEMKSALEAVYTHVHQITEGHIEGGDILVTEREILIGLSARTDVIGVESLKRITAPWSHKLRMVHTPAGVLHFKTDCSLLDAETILSTKLLDASGCFEGYRVIHVEDGEEACANAIRFNDLVLMPAGFPRTADKLDKAGYNVVEIGNSEAAKIDGGLSCLSLRLSPC